ncbi:MAG TPA: methyltransferase domain-containing protein [Polyangia bacterium]|nr:methyltransferase domain-containing protein [Polyangia bacterium]
MALFLRAALTNQVARFPFYLKLGDRSGRGAKAMRPKEAAAYFRGCARDLFVELGVDEGDAATFLRGKTVLEYGPGDTLGVALLLYAEGAASVHCVDRFPVHKLSERSIEVYGALLDGLRGAQRARAAGAFNEVGNPRSGLRPEVISYQVNPDGLSGRRAAYDLIISRSVLALVNHLDKTIEDIARALKPGGVSVHKVDLGSHGLDRDRPLDFLTWPDRLYDLMYSRKGRPNRWRVDTYQELARRAGLVIKKLVPTAELPHAQIEALLPALPSSFRAVPPELLSWLGFWIVLEPAAAMAAATSRSFRGDGADVWGAGGPGRAREVGRDGREARLAAAQRR